VTAGVTSIYRASSDRQQPELHRNNAGFDVDLYELHLTAGTQFEHQLEAPLKSARPSTARLRLFNFSGTQLATNSIGVPPGEALRSVPRVFHRGDRDVLYRRQFLEQLELQSVPGGKRRCRQRPSASMSCKSTSMPAASSTSVYDMKGDQNLFRDQGQILIHSNRISNSARVRRQYRCRSRDGAGQNPHQGCSARHARSQFEQRLVPGRRGENNVIFANATGAIRYSGDTNPAGQPLGGRSLRPNPEQYAGRIRNSDTGVLVQNNASPTLLNNIVTGFRQGVSVDGVRAPP
jgi:hypothetical protein